MTNTIETINTINTTTITANTTPLSPSSILSQYKQYLLDLSKSQNTIDTYSLHISEYLSFNNNSYTITRDSIKQYKFYLLITKHNSALTHNVKIAALKSFEEFLVYNNLQESLIIIHKDKIAIQKSILSPCTVTDKQVYNLIDKIKDKDSFRNYAIVYVLANTGLRISECLNIKLNDIDYEESTLLVIGKGNKQRKVTLTNKVIDVITEYINNHRPNVKSEYLFISQKSNNNYKLSRKTINTIFNEYTKIMTPHTMRHFRAKDMVKNSGLTIGEIADELGHSNIQTTIGYTYSNINEKREKLNKM